MLKSENETEKQASKNTINAHMNECTHVCAHANAHQQDSLKRYVHRDDFLDGVLDDLTLL